MIEEAHGWQRGLFQEMVGREKERDREAQRPGARAEAGGATAVRVGARVALVGSGVCAPKRSGGAGDWRGGGSHVRSSAGPHPAAAACARLRSSRLQTDPQRLTQGALSSRGFVARLARLGALSRCLVAAFPFRSRRLAAGVAGDMRWAHTTTAQMGSGPVDAQSWAAEHGGAARRTGAEHADWRARWQCWGACRRCAAGAGPGIGGGPAAVQVAAPSTATPPANTRRAVPNALRPRAPRRACVVFLCCCRTAATPVLCGLCRRARAGAPTTGRARQHTCQQ